MAEPAGSAPDRLRIDQPDADVLQVVIQTLLGGESGRRLRAMLAERTALSEEDLEGSLQRILTALRAPPGTD